MRGPCAGDGESEESGDACAIIEWRPQELPGAEEMGRKGSMPATQGPEERSPEDRCHLCAWCSLPCLLAFLMWSLPAIREEWRIVLTWQEKSPFLTRLI